MRVETARLGKVAPGGREVPVPRLESRLRGPQVPVVSRSPDRLVRPVHGLAVMVLGLGDEPELEIGAGRPGLERLGCERLRPGSGPVPCVVGG